MALVRRRPRYPGWTLVCALGLVLAVAYVAVPYSDISELVLYDGVVLLSVLGAVAGLRRAKGRARRAWWCVTAAFSGFFVGELIWWWYAANGQDPYPSIGDGFFLVAYVPLAAAAAFLAATKDGNRDATAWLDAAVLAVVAGVFMWATMMQPYIDDPETGHLTLAVSLAYPLADLLALGFLLRLLFARGTRDATAAMFATGLVLTLTGDIVFAALDSTGAYVPGSVVDLCWLLGYLGVSFAWLPRPATGTATPRLGDSIGRARLVLVLGAILVTQGALLASLGGAGLLRADSVTVAAGASLAVMVLVSLRLWGLLARARAAEARRGDERLAAFVLHSADAILLLDEELRIAFASPAARALLAAPGAEPLGQELVQAFAPRDRSIIGRQLANLEAMPLGATLPLDGSVTGGDGELRIVEGTGSNLRGDPSVGGLLITLRDVTVRSELEEQLRRRAFHDDLTGLANRALFADRLANALDRAARDPNAHVAVLFVDLDDFKAVNDGMGHAAGDELLRSVAARLTAGLRPGDTVARLGGDEFAVLIERVPSASYAGEAALRLLELLSLPLDVGGISLAVPASIGVTASLPGSTVESVLRDADIAMYTAKAKGKCQVALFDEALREAAARRLALKVELPEAHQRGQFRLEYQPIMAVSGTLITGFEALMRWDRADGRTAMPAEFIAAAEECGAIVDIGRWALYESSRQAALWNAGGRRLSMHVNVSAVQLHAPGFSGDLRDALSCSGLDPELLTVELTESVLVDPDRVIGILEELRDIGVGIAIDDFGTGYSSLAYLQRFPVTSVKIDRSFVRGLSAEGGASLVQSIVALAEALGLSTVAEGVETDEELDGLSALECTHAQGFFLGRPQTPAQVEALLAGELPVPAPTAPAPADRS